MIDNYMEMRFKAISKNEAFARACVANFCLGLDPTLEQLNDIRTAVSEAVTNCVVHAYPNGNGEIFLKAEIENDLVKIIVADKGVGIENIEKAKEPFYSTKKGEERSGMGFAIMESFMDEMKVEKNGDCGIKVTLYKRIPTKEAVCVGSEWIANK